MAMWFLVKQSKDCRNACETLVTTANANRGLDNVTVLAIEGIIL